MTKSMNRLMATFYFVSCLLLLCLCGNGCNQSENERVDKRHAVAKAATKNITDAGTITKSSLSNEPQAKGASKVPEKKTESLRPAGADGEKFETLETLPPPKPTMSVPKVIVKDLGLSSPPVPGTIYDVFVDKKRRPKYIVTEKAIFFMRSNGKVKKKIARKGDPRVTPETARVLFSDDGHWIWQVYVPEKYAKINLYSEATRSDVYDSRGRLWWRVKGDLETISPNGKRGTVRLPEASGLELWDKESNSRKFVENKRISGMNACAFNEGFFFIAGSEISVYNEKFEKNVVKRIKGGCMLDGCLPSVNRVIIDCTGTYEGKTNTNLFILDSKGREINKTWFPRVGNRLLDFDRKQGRAIIGVGTGESLYLNLSDGKVLSVTKRIDGFPEEIPESEFVGSRDDRLRYVSEYNREEQSKFFIERAALLDGAIARIKNKFYIHQGLEAKERIFEIVDLAGNVLFTKKFQVEDPASRATMFGFKLPAVWRRGKNARVSIGGKVHSVKATPEVGP